MYGNFPHIFDCWADPVDHLLLLKSSMPNASAEVSYKSFEVDVGIKQNLG